MQIHTNFQKRISVQCTHCGGSSVHFKGVHTFWRDSEDGGSRVAVRRRSLKVDKEMKSNPSSECNGVSLYLMCEECKCITKLCVIEHKGMVGIETQHQ